MKVLTVSTSDSDGGAARAAFRIHKAVCSAGVSGKMFVKSKCLDDDSVVGLDDFVPKNPFYRFFDWVACKIKNKYYQRLWNKYRNRDNVYYSDLRSTSLHGALRHFDFDVLHLQWTNMRFLNLRLLERVNKPIVWTLHDSWAFCGVCHYNYSCEKYKTHCGGCPFLHGDEDKDISYNVFEKKRRIYSHLDLHIVTPSRWLGERAKNSALLGGFPICVIPNCINTNLFKPSETKKETKVLRVLYGAMFAVEDPNKGFKELVQALHFLTDKYDAEYELAVYGNNNPIQIDVKMPVLSFGVIHDDSKMVELYNSADVVVVPSLSENLSNVIMESLSCGTPVVAFNIGGNGDMIDHKSNGYLANNPEDLGEGLHWCIENNQSGELSKNARQKVLDNFSPRIVGEKYKELYESVLRDK